MQEDVITCLAQLARPAHLLSGKNHCSASGTLGLNSSAMSTPSMNSLQSWLRSDPQSFGRGVIVQYARHVTQQHARLGLSRVPLRSERHYALLQRCMSIAVQHSYFESSPGMFSNPRRHTYTSSLKPVRNLLVKQLRELWCNFPRQS